ncbi:hypothetical protein [Methylobacterium sp. CM6257]
MRKRASTGVDGLMCCSELPLRFGVLAFTQKCATLAALTELVRRGHLVSHRRAVVIQLMALIVAAGFLTQLGDVTLDGHSQRHLNQNLRMRQGHGAA